MLNFTVGPVQMDARVLAMGSEQVPYFRTPEFSSVILENEELIKKFVRAPKGSRVVFLTGSGTASMEAAVMNTLSSSDRALLVNGGSFGHRFAQLCDIHEVQYDAIGLQPGDGLTQDCLVECARDVHTSFIINMGETSTGVLYDMELVASHCKDRNLFLIVDAISTFLADPIDMAGWGVDVLVIGSQKALAVPPGISILVLSPAAIERVESAKVKSMYFDLSLALKNGERGQTPFTPAVSVLLQINERLRGIDERGVCAEVEKVADLARDFRSKVEHLPFERFASSPSNAVTSLKTKGFSASEVFRVLKDEYGIWVCPNGGELSETVLRVGHIGSLTPEDNSALIDALESLRQRGLLGK